MNAVPGPLDGGPDDLPFPVTVPYRVRADLAWLNGTGPNQPGPNLPFPQDPHDPEILKEKRDALRDHPARIRVSDPSESPEIRHHTLTVTVPTFAGERPDIVHETNAPSEHTLTDAAGRHWVFPKLTLQDHEALRQTPAHLQLADALARSLPEDLVWMKDDSEGGRAHVLHVCFPSHWAPEIRGGASLLELHGPVADGDKLRKASTGLMHAIASKGPFRRFVWSLNTTPSLDRHPGATAPPGHAKQENPIENTWFRVERQTTLPHPEHGIAVFAIRVLVAPLTTVLQREAGRATLLAEAIRSMSDELKNYKGIREPEALLEQLDTFDA